MSTSTMQPDPTTNRSTTSRRRRVPRLALLFALPLLMAGCGGALVHGSGSSPAGLAAAAQKSVHGGGGRAASGGSGGGSSTAGDGSDDGGGVDASLDLGSWQEVRSGAFTALVPGDGSWQLTASAQGADVSNEEGTAEVGFGYATGGAEAYTYAGVIQLIAQGTNLSGLSVVTESAPFAEPDGTREVYVLEGYWNGVAAKAEMAIDLNGNGFSARLELADAQVWDQLQPTMDVIASQITFYGEEPPEVLPGHCQLDPNWQPDKNGVCDDAGPETPGIVTPGTVDPSN